MKFWIFFNENNFEDVGKYPSRNKECIQTYLDTEHNIKREFVTLSWLVSLYVR